MDVGHEQVVTQQYAMRVEQRQRVGEARGGAVADVHAHVTVGFDNGPQQLATDVGRDHVRVQLQQRCVALLQAQRLPHRAPERHRVNRLREALRKHFAQQLRSNAQQSGDQVRQVIDTDLDGG